MSKEFDFVLVFTTFRRCGVYIPIINELSNEYKIGIFPIELDRADIDKTNDSNRLFLNLCCNIGGVLIESLPVRATITLLPQWHYTQDHIVEIYSRIKSKKHFWLISLAMGNYNYDNLYGRKIDKYLVIDRKFYDYRLSYREKERTIKINENSVIEVGLPYYKYPFFNDIKIDYIWANPTPYSFPEVKDRLSYLESVSHLLDQISPNDKIVFKPHNAAEKYDYLVNNKISRVLNMPIICKFRYLLASFSRLLLCLLPKGKVSNLFCEVVIVDLYACLMKRVTPLKEMTKYHNFNLELFLPNLKKGLITGRSNSIWHALYVKKPVYNCVSDETSMIREEKMHSLNMKYFDVKGCDGELHFNENKYDVISSESRHADLIRYLKHEICQ